MRLTGFTLAACLLGGCGIPSVTPDVFRHSLTVQPNGNPVRLEIDPPIPEFPGPGEWSFDDQMQLITATDQWRRKERVLIFIHGGLNSIEGGLERTAIAAPRIVLESAGRTYPVMVNWNSDLFSGYWDHLFRYHNGEAANSFWRGLAAPFVLLADVGRSVARLPIVYWTQGSELAGRIVSNETGAEVPAQWRDRVRLNDKAPRWSTGERVLDTVTQFFPGLARIVTTPAIDTVGFKGYEFLQRRVDTQFFTNDDLRARTTRPSGALYSLMEHISTDTEIVLIGHSMGSIAANELIRRFPDHRYTSIVYMGAACTVKDFFDAVPDYIGHSIERGQECNFYNLCLHPAADKNEVAAWSLVPNGSLLEWLDAYVLKPRNLMHRTLGKWNNAVRVLHLLEAIDPEVLRRIHMKGFTVDGDKFPSTHGSFDEFRFWCADFWDPNNLDPVERCDPSQGE